MITIKNEVKELQTYFSPFGYLDLKAACEIGDQVDLYEGELFDIIDNFRELCGMSLYDKIDPVYVILDYILEMARSHIAEVSGYDFINDYAGN